VSALFVETRTLFDGLVPFAGEHPTGVGYLTASGVGWLGLVLPLVIALLCLARVDLRSVPRWYWATCSVGLLLTFATMGVAYTEDRTGGAVFLLPLALVWATVFFTLLVPDLLAGYALTGHLGTYVGGVGIADGLVVQPLVAVATLGLWRSVLRQEAPSHA
jgi:hypothetical protein